MRLMRNLRSISARHLPVGCYVEFQVLAKHLGMEDVTRRVGIFARVGFTQEFVTNDFNNPNMRISPSDSTAFIPNIVKADDLITYQST